MARPVSMMAFAFVALLTAAGAACAADGNAVKSKSKTSASRHGGYSYSQDQTINTSGDARGKYGAANSLRDPSFDRQTSFGPFDHGFFYDNGSGPGQHGGNSIYMH